MLCIVIIFSFDLGSKIDILSTMSLHVRSCGKLIKQFKLSSRYLAYHCALKLQLPTISDKQLFNSKPLSSATSYNNHIHKQWLHISYPCFESVTVKCPPFAESISEGDVRWEKAVGDSVVEDDTVAEIETDKTSIPIPAPASGVVEALLVDDGATVTPGTPLFQLNTDGAGAAASAAPIKEPALEHKTTPEPPQPPSEPDPVKIPETIPPIPPVPTQPLSTLKVSDIKITPLSQSPQAPSALTRSEHRVKMNRMRLRIAQRLKDSQNTAAMLTTFNEVDMSTIMAMRNKYKDAFLKKHGTKLSFMSAFIKASAYALQVIYLLNKSCCT